MSNKLRLCSLVVIALAAGCSDEPTTHTVQGRVSYQGEPVTGGLINFKLRTGHPLGGGIGSDGTFEFQLPAGEYQVRIDTPPPLPQGWKEGDPQPKMGKRQVPAKFSRFGSSGLSATVEAVSEPQQIDFLLN